MEEDQGEETTTGCKQLLQLKRLDPAIAETVSELDDIFTMK